MFSTLLIMLFVLCLVVAPRWQATVQPTASFGNNAKNPDFALPQDEPPAASSVSEAGEKFDETAFKTLMARNI